jgi:protein ImuB
MCRFHHYRAPPTACTLRLAAPEAGAERLLSLLRERLATLVLPEPVRRCELRGGVLSERPLASQPLWPVGEHGHAPAGEMPALVEHLRARLGVAAVYGIAAVSEHRPENAWRKKGTDLFIADRPVSSANAAEAINKSVPFFRPLWLLATPEPLEREKSQQWGRPRRQGALQLLRGPERIESGWWDGADVARDYYVARDSRGSLLWIYRDVLGWFLHGVFG